MIIGQPSLKPGGISLKLWRLFSYENKRYLLKKIFFHTLLFFLFFLHFLISPFLFSIFISSVRSSYSHPDLLLIHHHPTHFFRSHRSSTLDFHFLSHYSTAVRRHCTDWYEILALTDHEIYYIKIELDLRKFSM